MAIKLKEYFIKNFEQIFVLIVLVSVGLVNYYIPYKLAFLNFYYIPILLSAYYLGLRYTLYGAILCVLLVVIFVFLSPEAFLFEPTKFDIFFNISTWACFLILAGIIIGKVQEDNRGLHEKQLALNKKVSALSTQLSELKDVDAIFDRILLEARRLSNADAGTIFLVENEKLKFSYVHNETLIKAHEVNKEIYSNLTLPIDEKSIVGYVAFHGETLAIDDAYDIPDDLPFQFNPSFDQKSGYKTKSMIAFPIKTSQDKVVGVIQLINAKNDKGESVPFSEESRFFLPLFANNASVAIERGIMTRELILRMMRTAELRDPSETGAHVQRVGAYSAEIYHKWALNKGVDEKERKKMKDLIRVAAMLHDVGKVGISDAILKKPAKLDAEEFAIMQFHTMFGAQLFVNSTSELDALSGEIAANHHEQWNGTGYPGKITDLFCEAEMGEPKKREEIPLAARITALADVFDALCSKRSYKAPWPDEKILKIIKEEPGKHFDPDVVDAFLSIFDVIKAIREKYTEDDERDVECALETKIEAFGRNRKEKAETPASL